MTTFRIMNFARLKPSIADGAATATGEVVPGQAITVSQKTEIRSSQGGIFRLMPNAEFFLDNSTGENRPILSGEVFQVFFGDRPKYRTSCWGGRFVGSPPPMVHIRPSKEKEKTDEYLMVQGEMWVYEFDENNQAFTIATLTAGDKMLLSYDFGVSGSNRYRPTILRMSDAEFDFVMKGFVDPREWSLVR